MSESTGFRAWVAEHDERWTFVLLYIGLAVLLSVFVSLFWLVVVAAAHFLLECMRQSQRLSGARDVLSGALWEIKLDVGLVLMALILALYVDVVFGLLGLHSAARAGAVARVGLRVGSRAAAWERNIRTALIVVDDALRLGQGAAMVRRRKQGGVGGVDAAGMAVAVDAAAAQRAAAAAAEAAAAKVEAARTAAALAVAVPGWRAPWSLGDRIALALNAVGILLLVAAPLLTSQDLSGVLATLQTQLKPFPPS
jgi:hypothetical protein